MRVLIHDAVFSDGVASEDDLDELLLLVLKGRHLAHLLDEPSPHVSAWLAARGWTERWQSATANARRSGARNPLVHVIEVDVVGSADARSRVSRMDVRAAVRILRQPLRILVENGRNDAHLLRALSALDGRLASLRELEADGDIEFDNGGGLPEMHARMAGYVRDPHDRLRRFPIFDSDALAPDQPSKAARDLAGLCERNHVGHHLLTRRAAENYVPPPRLEEWGDAQDDEMKRRARAWCKLSAPQRHHFAMRDGLAKDEGNPTAGHLDGRRDRTSGRDLFDGLDVGPRTILQRGFGRPVRGLFDGDRPEWERWMREDGQTDEVRALFREMFSRL